jgi:hypothetical protein
MADAVYHNTLLADRVDHVVREHLQRSIAVLPIADLEAMGILCDVPPTTFKFISEAGSSVGSKPFQKETVR